MKILTVVGNRPQFIKAAAVSGLLRKEHTEVLVHTGQHYDDTLSKVFFTELGLAKPDRELNIGGGSNESQTTRMLSALEELIPEVAPDAVLVYGDTNSTLAGAQAGEHSQIPVIHIEAGMRSFDPTMPEERNRIATDRLSELLLCSSETAAGNLRAEGISGRVEVVGDVMVDRFVYGDVSRVSAEAPVPILARARESVMLGAAGNVARNVAALGGQATLIGVVGEDAAAEEARDLIAGEAGARGALTAAMISDPSRPTTTKVRFVSAGQQLLRVDHEVVRPV